MHVVVVLFVVDGPTGVVVGRRDSKDHATPLVQNSLGEILHLWHAGSVLGVDLDGSGQFGTVLEEDRLDVKRVNHMKDFLHYFHVRVCSVREWI